MSSSLYPFPAEVSGAASSHHGVVGHPPVQAAAAVEGHPRQPPDFADPATAAAAAGAAGGPGDQAVDLPGVLVPPPSVGGHGFAPEGVAHPQPPAGAAGVAADILGGLLVAQIPPAEIEVAEVADVDLPLPSVDSLLGHEDSRITPLRGPYLVGQPAY